MATDDEFVELRHLRAFEAVVRCGGFTRAARDLHVAQPAISAQVRALETELGISLLVRSTRHVALTEAGELLLERVRRILGELVAARGDLEELSAVSRGRVDLGATPMVAGIDLPRALAEFHARYPAVTVTLRSGLITELLASLDAGELDAVLGPIHPDLPSRYSAHALVDEELVLVLPVERQPTLESSSISLDDLRDESFVCLPYGSGLRTLLDQAAADAGFQPRVQFEAATPDAVRGLVAAGLGVAVLARSAAEVPGPPVTVLALRASTHPPIGLIDRSDRATPPATRACLEHITAATGHRPTSASR